MIDNNRQNKRIEKVISLLFSVADALPKTWDMSVIENISIGGVMFLAPSDLKLIDKIVHLRIKIPELAPHFLELEAVVLSVRPRFNGKSSDVRAKFINLSKINKEHLSILEGMIEKYGAKQKLS